MNLRLAILRPVALVGAATILSACGASDRAPVATVTVTADAQDESSPAEPEDEPSADWESDAIEQLGPAAVRLKVSTCDETGSGSGFLVAPDLIVTAAHVVIGASTVSAASGETIANADVLGIDESTDTALLRSSAPLADEAMELATADPRQGSGVLVLGYPLGVQDLRNTSGRVTGGNTAVDYGDQKVSPVITTDAAINPGNSGGPALDRESRVVGLVSGAMQWTDDGEGGYDPVDGIKYLVPVSAFADQVERWRNEEPQALTSCEGDIEPSEDYGDELEVDILSEDPLAENLAQTLYTHGEGINTGAYDSAWAMFTPAAQGRFDFATWSEDLYSTYWIDLAVADVTSDGDTAVARVDLTTWQDASASALGESCTVFHLDYVMAYVDGSWLIDEVDQREPTEAC